MKVMLGILSYVVGFLVERVSDLGGFAHIGGARLAWWMAAGCYFMTGWLWMEAAREYWKKKQNPNE